jgi:chromosomal replication initiation ATPase DnaA
MNQETNPLSISLADIKHFVENELEVNISMNTRKREYVYARAIFFKLCREFSHQTLSKIGEFVGRDHASVMHGLYVFDVIVLHNDSILNSYTKVRNKIFEETEDGLSKYNRENYYKIKYEQLLEEHQELQIKYDLNYETQNTTTN